jgi:hypothetical protein
LAPAAALQVSETEASPAVAVSPAGTAGTTVPLASADPSDMPPALTARTLKKYCWPGINAVNIAGGMLMPLWDAVAPSPPALVPWNTL